MIDPISLATLTSAVTVLGAECIKGASRGAGQDLWGKVKSLFNWGADPDLADLAVKVASKL
jgi:hypothetical protein